jgi:hypothetical protein
MPGTWGPLAHQPTFNAGTMLLLTDGTVMCQNSNTVQWFKLTPDSSGSYVNGTWTQLANCPNPRLYFASAVLRDGRVFVAGGEYAGGSSAVDLFAADMYNPANNTWSPIPLTTLSALGWSNIGDAACCAFPDGRVMIGNLFDGKCAIYDPVANSWSAAGTALNRTNEATWTLLPDQTISTCDCFGHPATEKYVIPANQWVSTGNTSQDLVEAASFETGPAILLPDGRLFAIGATGHTALYTMPPNANQPGTWTAGPNFPQIAGKTIGAKDAPAVLLPNGHVLCAVGPVDGVAGNYLSPTYFFEYDPTSNTLTQVATPPTSGGPPFTGRLLLLPNAQVLFANGSTNVQVYTPSGGPDLAWKPQITGVSSSLIIGGTTVLFGRQINGLSQACAYGDDATMATNYPIVRLAAGGNVFYCRTFNHSTLGVNTGTVVHSTHVNIPATAPAGSATLTVIANGIPSDPVNVNLSHKLKEFKELKEFKDFDIFVTATGEPALESIADQLPAEGGEGQQEPFIGEDERPDVGGNASPQYPPPSSEKK